MPFWRLFVRMYQYLKRKFTSSEPSLLSSKCLAQPNIARRWKEPVSAAHTDLICLLLFFLTGLCDSSAYNGWSCFLGMQTGNTVFLGLGASHQPETRPWGWLKSIVSMLSFFLGAVAFSIGMRGAGALRRSTLFLSFFVQTLLILIAVSLIETDITPLAFTNFDEDGLRDGEPPFLELVPISILAFQSAGGMAFSRALGYSEMPTVVLTTVYFDIASDPRLTDCTTANPKRNRRLGGVVALLIGAISGGWLSRSDGGMESSFWTAAGLKGVVAFAWLFWKAAPIS
ncbi:unnamed protein product [Penicillium olsonii]|nr:unnamed protein product [Penicillium olsonii]